MNATAIIGFFGGFALGYAICYIKAVAIIAHIAGSVAKMENGRNGTR